MRIATIFASHESSGWYNYYLGGSHQEQSLPLIVEITYNRHRNNTIVQENVYILFIHIRRITYVMVKKTDSFFIRQTLNADNTTTFQQTPIDLGAYVDALGKAVLRIHNIAVTISDSAGTALQVAASKTAAAQFQLTTQSQADTVLSSNRSVIASGIVYAVNDQNAAAFPKVSHDMDVLPQMWTNGYLVAVDTIYLGGEASTHFEEDVYISVTLECTVESMSEAAGLALALSQQGA